MAKAKEIITVFTKETYFALSDIQKNQHPFALAKSITDVATGAVKRVQMQTDSAFDLKSRNFILKGIKRTPAKKSDVKSKGRATSVVFTMPRISGFMPIHEEGGTREAYAGSKGNDKGKYMVIPGEDFENKIVTSTGKTKAHWRPSKLLAGYQNKNNRTRRGTGSKKGGRRKKAFIVRLRGGTPAIVRRRTKNRYPLEILYIFSKTTKYKPVWRFEETVDNYVGRAFKTIYKRNLRLAVRNAK